MNKLLYLLPTLVLAACANYGQLKAITKLPDKLSENSGIAQFDQESVWFIEDKGNKDIIYEVDFNGKIRKEFEVKNAKNNDWEDLTSDKKGNLYIGDFGNNANHRKNLVIYKLPNPDIEPGDKIEAERIEFQYPEQKEYPPKKKELVYDSEAFFYLQGHFYIFTKNRAHPFSGEVSIYRVPLKVGRHNATLLGTITTCEERNTCQVTSADISPDGKTVVLLGYGKLWTLTDFTGDSFFEGKLTEIDLGVRTQLESVCFKDGTTLLLSDEVRDNEGGMLYSYSLK
ncbi:hypothetical protein [Maribacter sp. 2307UL18-2]|uniref:hypothetical protein n=1 Tax=Maribacter sp. 2307UL18-2 TaxID=3386274 RepID=UPI0039BD723E